MTRTDEEIRHLAISLLKLPTARDQQTRVGASNISNQCDRCLAYNFAGDDRSTPILDQAWMGRVLGTAFHGLLESRMRDLLGEGDNLDERQLAVARRHMELMVGSFPQAKPETHVFFGQLENYGAVGGTIDLDLGEDDDQLIDWKGSDRQKICLLIDALAMQRGLEPVFGRKHKYMALFEQGKDGVFRKVADQLSEKEYAAGIEKMTYKVTGYFGQAQLYMKGAGRSRASLVFIARDGTGYFDNPEAGRYDDPTAIHDVHVLSFDYDEHYADALLARAQAIVSHLHEGGAPADLNSHPLCFSCSQEAKDRTSIVEVEVSYTAPAAA